MDKDQAQAELLVWLKEAAERGGAFIEREAPLLAEEIVAWHFWSNMIGVVFAGSVVIAAAIICRQSYKSWCREEAKPISEQHWELPMVSCLLSIAVAIFSTLVLVFTSVEAAKAVIAPRVVVVEYLSGK